MKYHLKIRTSGNRTSGDRTSGGPPVYSEKATKFCEIFTLLLSYVVPVKSKVKISKIFVAFSEYMNFTTHKGALETKTCVVLLCPFKKIFQIG